MSVLEVWPEPGYYTAIIAPLLRDKGKYYAAVIGADPANKHITQRLDDYRQRLADRPDLADLEALEARSFQDLNPTDGIASGRGRGPAWLSPSPGPSLQ